MGSMAFLRENFYFIKTKAYVGPTLALISLIYHLPLNDLSSILVNECIFLFLPTPK